MVYGVFSQAERGQSEKGLADTLEKAGLKVDRLEITQEVNSDTSLGIPVLAAYIEAHPNLKAIGTQHGGVTSVMDQVLKKAGKKPGEIVVGGIDLAPGTIGALKSGYVSATLDQLLYLQGYMPVLQCVMTAKYKMPGPVAQHRRRRRHAEDDRRADQADRRGHPLTAERNPLPLILSLSKDEGRMAAERPGEGRGARGEEIVCVTPFDPALLLPLLAGQPPAHLKAASCDHALEPLRGCGRFVMESAASPLTPPMN